MWHMFPYCSQLYDNLYYNVSGRWSDMSFIMIWDSWNSSTQFVTILSISVEPYYVNLVGRDMSG